MKFYNFAELNLIFCRTPTSLEIKRIPPIKWNASRWQVLIDLTDIEFQKPATTQHLSNAEIFSLNQKDSLCEIPDLPSYSKALSKVLNWCLTLYTQFMVMKTDTSQF